MYNLSVRDPHVIGTLTAAVLCGAGVASYLVFRRRPTAEEIERDRRALLVRSGRIIDGTILDVTDLSGAVSVQDGANSDIQFVLYQYEIGGVQYECSQEVSGLHDYFKPEDLRPGFPCSVRYDVHHPENSIVIAENWSGLRTTAQSVPVQKRSSPHGPRTSAPAAR